MSPKTECSILSEKRHFSKKSLEKVAILTKVVGESLNILQKLLGKVYITIKSHLKKSLNSKKVVRKKSHGGQNAEEEN